MQKRKYIRSFHLSGLIFLCLFLSCTKENIIVDPDNEPVSTFNISRIKIENYVNRIYIDIIGREPLKTEQVAEVAFLQENALSREARESIITKLMTDTTYREFEESYKAAYVLNLYTLAKVRSLEGVSDEEIESLMGIIAFGALQDSLLMNWDAFYRKKAEIYRFEVVLNSRHALYDGIMKYHEIFTTIVDNGVYDQINMNTFNFVRAVYDELLWRLPTDQELNVAFEMVENNTPGMVFGKMGSSKADFIDHLISSSAMAEGMIIWAFQVFLKRPPTPQEVITFLPQYIETKDINFIIKQILVTDEYANFR